MKLTTFKAIASFAAASVITFLAIFNTLGFVLGLWETSFEGWGWLAALWLCSVMYFVDGFSALRKKRKHGDHFLSAQRQRYFLEISNLIMDCTCRTPREKGVLASYLPIVEKPNAYVPHYVSEKDCPLMDNKEFWHELKEIWLDTTIPQVTVTPKMVRKALQKTREKISAAHAIQTAPTGAADDGS